MPAVVVGGTMLGSSIVARGIPGDVYPLDIAAYIALGYFGAHWMHNRVMETFGYWHIECVT